MSEQQNSAVELLFRRRKTFNLNSVRLSEKWLHPDDTTLIFKQIYQEFVQRKNSIFRIGRSYTSSFKADADVQRDVPHFDEALSWDVRNILRLSQTQSNERVFKIISESLRFLFGNKTWSTITVHMIIIFVKSTHISFPDIKFAIGSYI